jgi:uncharacterized protein YigA (DUF484 family)
MATERANDLRAFKSFIDQQLAGEPVPTVDEVLARWNCETQSDEERASAAQAASESLADTEKVVAELRKKFGLTCDALALQSNPEEWGKRLQALVDSQPIRPNNMDDSRESIYAGRGE